MYELYCSIETTAKVALCTANLILVLPPLIFLYLRVRSVSRVLGYPRRRSSVWRYLWDVDLAHITGAVGAGSRILIAVVALLFTLLVVYAVSLPIVLILASFATRCPAHVL